MSTYSDQLSAIRAARTARDTAKDALYKTRLKRFALNKAQKQYINKELVVEKPAARPTLGPQKKNDAVNPRRPHIAPDRTRELEETQKTIANQVSDVNKYNSAVRASIEDLFGQSTPQDVIEQWSGTVPIALLPVRMETKYMTSDLAKRLYVRIYPDDIAVVTHEEMLTSRELDAGITLWKTLWQAKDDATKKQASWTLLGKQVGANRAAWVSLKTKPSNWPGAALATENDLTFSVDELTKPHSWTQAPHTRVMPDRFILLGYRGGKLKFSKLGKQIDDILVLGPAPLEDDAKPSFRRDLQNRLHYGEDFKWMFDFSAAVEAGLGFEISDADLQNGGSVTDGFDQLIAVGLKLSCDHKDGRHLLEDLLTNHNFSKQGLALIKQGTPTNNTEEKDAGFTAKSHIEEISTHIERGTFFFDVANERDPATDGQRLAEYLGIGYPALQLVPNSGIKDHSEAVAMNQALYASTLGYYLHSMLNDVLDDTAIQQVRDHFTNHVTGRGPIASIRVGNQPYGVVLSSAFSRWLPPPAAVADSSKYPSNVVASSAATSAASNDAFLYSLYKILRYLEVTWDSLVADLSTIHKQGDPGTNLMSVLGLHPTSVEFFQRMSSSFDHLINLESFCWDQTYSVDAFKSALERTQALQILRNLGYHGEEEDGSPKPLPLLLQLAYHPEHTLLSANNLIDDQPLSEDSTIKPFRIDADSPLNYIHWLLNNISDSSKLEKEDFEGASAPTSLLYMLLRNSLLLETSHSLYKFFLRNNISATELIRSRKFMNITSVPSVSHWEVFQAPANKLVPAVTSEDSMFKFIHSPQFVGGVGIAENLNDFKSALEVLKDMSTASLERAMTEHLDTLTYRLDAWQTSLFDVRLQYHRQHPRKEEIDPDSPDRATGIYMGAYGYLENVKPSVNKRTKVPEGRLPEELRENKDNLFVEANNGGFVHAPSLNHAAAAAILRSGYLTHANPADQETFSVNLSSERVRRAKYLLDGIRNGQTLEVLLGYQFERGLQEWSTRSENPVVLNDLIPLFRQAFPIKKTKVPQEGKVTGPEEVIEDYSVVNGMALAQSAIDSPYGIVTSSSLSTDQTNALRTEKNNIANTLDALRDVLTSESAYQLVLGNFDRAAAVMQAISDGHMPPDIQVIDSSRGTDFSFTNRVGIHFESGVTTSPWPVEMGPSLKASTEPGMNHWIGTILGDPSNIRCRAKALDKEGNEVIGAYVSLDKLNIQPIDFIYLIRSRVDGSAATELETRIRHYFAQTNRLTDDTVVKIEFNETDSPDDRNVKSFAEVLPLANYIRNIVSGSRPLKATDYDSPSKRVPVSSDNPDNIDVTELQTRIKTATEAFSSLITPLETAISDATTTRSEANANALRDKLKAVADAGLIHAFPQSAFGFDQRQIDVLVTQGQSVITRLKIIKENNDARLTVVNGAKSTVQQKVNVLTEMARALLGDDYAILPRFDLNDVAEVTRAFDTRGDLLMYSKDTLKMSLVVNEWLHGVSLVRPKMQTFELIRLLNDTFNTSDDESKRIAVQLEPLQIPYKNKASWLAVEYPADTTIEHDTISFVSCNPQQFHPLNKLCGLLVDEWVEVIPHADEVTGISFNYNQPNTVPPQAIVLAVSPQEKGNWNWQDLVDTILETFDRARRRAVEPDLLDQVGGVSTLLPALLSEFSTARNSISLDYALSVPSIAVAVRALEQNNG